MALTKCIKCGGHYFEVVEHEPRGSNFKNIFVQCSSCGTPVGVMDYYNIGSLMKKQEDKLDELTSKMERLEGILLRILRELSK